MTAIFKRELKAYFYSPMAYIYLTVFFFISGFLFLMSNLAMKTSNMSYVFSGVFTIIMIMLPLLTMRLFSDEKKLKTEQGLLTAPVSLSGIVFGKFFAAGIYTLSVHAQQTGGKDSSSLDHLQLCGTYPSRRSIHLDRPVHIEPHGISDRCCDTDVYSQSFPVYDRYARKQCVHRCCQKGYDCHRLL